MSYQLMIGETYTIKVTVTNQTTRGGQPWEADLTVGIAASVSDGFATIELIPSAETTSHFAPASSLPFTFPMSVPSTAAGMTGGISVGVRDPFGKLLDSENVEVIIAECVPGSSKCVGYELWSCSLEGRWVLEDPEGCMTRLEKLLAMAARGEWTATEQELADIGDMTADERAQVIHIAYVYVEALVAAEEAATGTDMRVGWDAGQGYIVVAETSTYPWEDWIDFHDPTWDHTPHVDTDWEQTWIDFYDPTWDNNVPWDNWEDYPPWDDVPWDNWDNWNDYPWPDWDNAWIDFYDPGWDNA